MAKKKRKDFYKLLMYVIFTLLNSRVDTEVKSVLGRADVVVKTDEISLLLCHLCHSAIWHNLCKYGKNGVFRAFYKKMPNGILAEVAQNWVTSRENQRNVTAKLTQRHGKINATLQQNLRNVTAKFTQRYA